MISEVAAALVEAELWSEPLHPADADPGAVLASMAEDGHSFALTGCWAGSAAIVGSEPIGVLAPTDDPFDHLTYRGGTPGGSIGGGWFGMLGYQLGARLEALPPAPPRPVPLPASWMGLYDHVLRLDESGRWWFEALVTSDREMALENRLRTLEQRLAEPPGPVGPFSCDPLRLVPDPARHRERVRRTVEEIHAGELFQANICLRVEGRFDGSPLAAFRHLVPALGSPYGAFLDLGDRAVVSMSPELFLRRSARRVLTNPIKGTIERDRSDRGEADRARARLESSEKDRAENVMIVDLMRNDLSRVSAPGTVRTPAIARVEPHPGVWHLVSEVEATLSDGVDDGTMLRACFPPGSVTGAPKVRAMELINGLESTGREAYTGAIGFSSPRAGLEMNVAIRTFEFGEGRVWLGVGGGIVADSDPYAELDECLSKAGPLVAALGTTIAEPSPAPTVGAGGSAGAAVGGLIETMLVVDGVVVELAQHLERLSSSTAVLWGEAPAADLAERVQREARAAGAGRRRLRLVVEQAGVAVSSDLAVTPVDAARAPARLVRLELPGGHGPHKIVDRDRLSTPGGEEPLITDADRVLETGRANLFAVSGRTLYTAPLDGRILPGTVRDWVLRTAGEHGLRVDESPLRVEALAAADEVFTTSSIRGVNPVVSCAGVGSWPVGPITLLLSEARERHVRATVERCGGRVERGSDPWPSRGPLGPGRLVVIDNYDSFTFNLVHHLGELGTDSVVVRNDEISIDELLEARPRGVVLSPGPAGPDDAGICVEVVRRLDATTPLLGVCLGHQCLGAAFGGSVVRAPVVVHGKVSEVHHGGSGLFSGIDDPMPVTRYHSLIVDEPSLPDQLEVTARTSDGLIMGLSHISRPLYGVQFHPEAVLTRDGRRLLANFLAVTGAGPPSIRRGSRPVPLRPA